MNLVHVTHTHTVYHHAPVRTSSIASRSRVAPPPTGAGHAALTSRRGAAMRAAAIRCCARCTSYASKDQLEGGAKAAVEAVRMWSARNGLGSRDVCVVSFIQVMRRAELPIWLHGLESRRSPPPAMLPGAGSILGPTCTRRPTPLFTHICDIPPGKHTDRPDDVKEVVRDMQTSQTTAYPRDLSFHER
ncbi:hypothetical protein CERSUDRAFT_99769 [Gelatoporia subvermispora B]|uniref:Uncharacterized protein n=1 Tax=Ceriporiopsis subvermispora (strain B) TaxID=914234 RepID=M2QIY9_CERS8|nr:hypothetical protein CERSUDRAFT_99769 [Gelatoporia subvermispora B]